MRLAHTRTKKLLHAGITLVTGLVIGHVAAQNGTYAGKVVTELPKVTITSTDVPVSDVKLFNVTVSQSGGVCSISEKTTVAQKHGTKPTCLITWDDPLGLNTYLLGLRGVVKGSGSKTFSYTLTMFDKDKFDPILSKNYSVTFVAPIVPDTPTFTSTWTLRPDTPLASHDIYNRGEVNKLIRFENTPRNYIQKISFGQFSCEIPEDGTSCVVNVSESFKDVSVQGEKTQPITAGDTFDFFKPSPINFKYVWDFRPPEIIGVHLNSTDTGLPKVISDYESPLVLLQDQAAVVIRSPHANIEDAWWQPTDPTLKIIPNKEQNTSNKIDINGVDVVYDLGSTMQKAFETSPIAKPVRIGDYLVYVYDFAEISDGLYDFEFSTLDSNGNGELKTLANQYIDRNPPDIQFLVNNKQIRTNSVADTYALSDITITAWGGWNDGSEIVSATIDDEPVEFAGGTALIKRLANADIARGVLHQLEVVAQDKTGNKRSKILDFKFGAVDFKVQSDDVAAMVQEATIDAIRINGISCVYATDEEIARIYSEKSGGKKRGCTVEWLTIPEGLDISEASSTSVSAMRLAKGFIPSAGEHPYDFKIRQFDAYGVGQEIFHATGVIKATEIEAPQISVGTQYISENLSDTYHYKQPVDQKTLIQASILGLPNSKLVVELRDDKGTVVETKVIEGKRSAAAATFIQPTTQASLTEGKYTVRAYYQDHADIFNEKDYHFYVTPSNKLRLQVNHLDNAVLGTDFPIKASVGTFSSNGIYYAAEFGEWDVRFVRMNKESGEYEDVIAPQTTDNLGLVKTTIPSELLNQNGKGIVAIAKLKTPYPEIEFELQTYSLSRVNVLTLDSLDASLSVNEEKAVIPAVFYLNVKFADNVDKNTVESIQFETSDDGVQWVPYGQALTRSSMSLRMSEPSTKFVRASIKHLLTKEVTTTSTMKLTAYDQPLLTISGDKRVLSGAIGQYNYALNSFAQANQSGDVEWSLDNGTTWNAMTPSSQATITGPTTITARVLIDTPEDAPYYVTDTFMVDDVDPTPLRASVTSNSYSAEIGDVVTVKARFAKKDNVIEPHQKYEFILPSGEKKQALELSHTLAASDFTNGSSIIRFRTWLDGHELQTSTTTQVPIKQLVYSFPDTDVLLPDTPRVAHSSILMRYVKPTLGLPKSVEISQSVELSPQMSLVKDRNTSAVLEAATEGVYPVKVRFFDNRGNEREHTRMVEVLEPPPMEATLDVKFTSKYMRPPLRMTARTYAKLGANLDKIKQITLLLNGEEVSANAYTYQRLLITEPGDYTLTMNVESEYGQEGSAEQTFTVLPNKLPHCEPFWEDRGRSVTLNVNCSDDDGIVARVDLTFNDADGNLVTNTRYFVHQFTFLKTSATEFSDIKIRVVDDSSEETSLSVDTPSF